MKMRSKQQSQQQNQRHRALVSAVALLLLNGLTPSMCFGTAPRRRASLTRRHFQSSDYDVSVRSSGVLQQPSFTPPPATSPAMPTWLSIPQGHLSDQNRNALREAMTASFFTENETQKLLSAIHEASGGDAQKMAGAAEFCCLLVETMEMGLNALLAAAFHYCSCVSARERIVVMTPSSLKSAYVLPASLESFGTHAARIAHDADRLKQLEMVASMVTPDSERARDAENLKNLLLTETKDWRALAIRSAACLYRLRGILKSESWNILTPESNQASREALNIYAPLASRLGMHRLKNELEGAAFQILYRRQYETVTSLAHQTRFEAQEESQRRLLEPNKSGSGVGIGESMKIVLNQVQEEMTEILKNDPEFSMNVQDFQVTARVKEPYSMWRKMLRNRSTHILQVPDAVALRIVLQARPLSPNEDTEVTRARERALCYYAQKLCMKHWKPLEGNARFKDYIESPKPNGYQSLHYTASTHWGGEDWTMEIQVRSQEMHKIAEYGLASHWDYKAQKKGAADSAFAERIHENFAKIDDQSTDAYLRSLQQWHWEQQARHAASPTASSSHPDDAESQIRADRIRARTERLEPYIQALTEAQSDLARDHVFVFITQSEGMSEGKVLALPSGACVWDALREGAKDLGISLPWNDEEASRFFHNGGTLLPTARLQNGDVLSVPSVSMSF